MPQVIQRYQIEEEFDKEAFGVIYKAKDLQTQEIVELGIIDSGLGEYRSEIEEILSHKHIISKINHENIARLHDFFQHEKNYILVREHIPASATLSRWITSDDYSYKAVGEILSQICDALNHAHEQGVAYNYITPSTIKIDNSGKIKITNLGFSKLFRASYSGSDSIVESANFLSPEHIQELPGDIRSDVYSLGVLLYLLLTKSLPFPGKNFAKIIAQKVKEVPPSPEQIDPRVPKMLSEVAMQAMQPEREARYADLVEFKEQLSAALKQAERGTTGRHVGHKFGNYEVIEILGHGAHSTVFKAIDTRFKKLVALKMLDYRLSMDEQFVRRFEREGIISERLHHNNIVGIIEKFEADDFFFLAIEYVDGVALDKLFETDAPLPFEKTYNLFKQICEAFGYVHEQGVVHRDIKPANIMINPEGTVKVLDFGIAKILDEATESLTKSPIGTPQYMSPEQCSTGEVDARSDIYSLGALLFKMVTGRVPFQSDKLHVLLKMHISEEPPVPSSLNPAIPEQIDKLILKALKKEKDERYASARDMLGQFLTAMRPVMITGHVGKSIGNYEIISVGKRRGGMAETFIGKDTTTTDLVFIKILQQDLSADEMFRERFLREIAVLRKMDHRNIVKVIDVVDEGETVYLVMTFVVGRDLQQILQERESFSPPQALPIFRQICDAIEYAHKQGVVHRDIKPANIMMEPNGKVYVLDFGIAKMLDSGTSTLTTMPIGTPAYMCPEQFTLDTITPQSDIYSIGVLLYELLCGSKPFSSDGGYQQKHLKEPPVPLTKHIQIKKKINKIVLKALEKKPGDRYPDVGKFRDEFDKAVRRYYVEKAEIEIKHNASENVQSGDTIAFEVKAPADGLVRVKVEGLEEPILLKENTSLPGTYLGAYTVKEKDKITEGEVTALFDYSKPQKIDESGVQEVEGAETVVATAIAKEPVRIKKKDPKQLLRSARESYEGKKYRKALKVTEELIRDFPTYEGAEKLKQLCKEKLRRFYLQIAGSFEIVVLLLIVYTAYLYFQNPIESEPSPAAGEGTLAVNEGESMQFSVTATSKNDGALSYQWAVDGMAIPETDGKSYSFSPGLREAGPHTVSVEIADARNRARTHEWAVNVIDTVPVFAFDREPGNSYRVNGGEWFEVALEQIEFPSPKDLNFEWFAGGSKYEQGDGAKGLRYKSEYTDKGVKMISLIVSSDTLQEPVEMDWTLNIVPVDTLTRVTVDPKPGSAISLRIGTDSRKLIAKYQQRDNLKIDYAWKMDGKNIPGATSSEYTYKSSPEDKTPKEIAVHISDGLTSFSEKWSIEFEEYNPLHIPMWSPQKKQITLQEGKEQAFSVAAEHEWEDAKIAYKWSMFVDGKETERNEKSGDFSYKPGYDFVQEGNAKKVKIQVVTSDDRQHRLKPILWEIDVMNRPVLQDGPTPAPGPINKQEGETLIAKAPTKTLTGAKPKNKWLFQYGGEDFSSEDDTFKHRFPWDRKSDKDARGALRLTTEAWPDGKKEWKWDVLVKNRKYVNKPPVIDDFQTSKTSITEGESVTFTIKAHDPDPDQNLMYEFHFEDEPESILPSTENRYTYKTDVDLIKGAGKATSMKRTLVARITDTSEFDIKTTSARKEITIRNATGSPTISKVLLNDKPVTDNFQSDLEEKIIFKASADDPDRAEGDKVSFLWKVNGQNTGSDSLLQWTPPRVGKYNFSVTASDNAGKTDEKNWNIVIVSEKDLINAALEQMKGAYEKLDYEKMRYLSAANAYPEIDVFKGAMSGQDVSGLMIEYGEPGIEGTRAAVTCKMLKWRHSRKGWQDYPQEIEKNHRLVKQNGVWKFESLQLR